MNKFESNTAEFFFFVVEENDLFSVADCNFSWSCLYFCWCWEPKKCKVRVLHIAGKSQSQQMAMKSESYSATNCEKKESILKWMAAPKINMIICVQLFYRYYSEKKKKIKTKRK